MRLGTARGLLTAALLLAAAHAARASDGAPSEVADASFARTVILTSPQLELRVVSKPSATMADHRFIAFEIENRTEAPLTLGSLSASGRRPSTPARGRSSGRRTRSPSRRSPTAS